MKLKNLLDLKPTHKKFFFTKALPYMAVVTFFLVMLAFSFNISWISITVYLAVLVFLLVFALKLYKFEEEIIDFKESDPWLPKNLKTPETPTINQFIYSDLDAITKKEGYAKVIQKIEKELKELYRSKKEILLVQQKWQAVPILSNEELYKKSKQKRNHSSSLDDRSELYSRSERASIQTGFIELINSLDSLISQGNKAINKTRDKAREITYDTSEVSKITGVNLSDE
jgi:Ca2+/Na+ antiporter